MDQAKKTIKAKEEEIIKLKNTAENLTTKCRVTKHELSNENHELREELAVKETELGEAFEERVKLEEKMNSLLDLLYGCYECGLNQCECNDSLKEDKIELDSSTSLSKHHTSHLSPPTSPAAGHPLQPGCGTSPWTPPPTPPSKNCGGVNYGPSPGSLCFSCKPPLQIKAPSNSSSPSRTPPGTPPRTDHE